MEEFRIAWWGWVAFGMLLMLLELAVPSFTIFWFGLGGLVVGLLLLVVPDVTLTWQILVWVAASSAFALFWFRVLKPRMVDRTKAGISREAVVGETALVIRPPEGARRGELRFSVPVLGAESWPFICDGEVAAGDRVVVRDVSGNTMMVRKYTNQDKQEG